jgi:D-arabinose 1-dehydrogenase-like Zn-dependent alcohol dehydrogenase
LHELREQAQGIKPRIELMPMAQVNEAIRRVKENKARYRIVLVNQNGGAEA